MKAMIGWGLLGLILRMVSKGFEAMGDAAPIAAGGMSGERLGFHLVALMLLAAAIYCFFRMLRHAWRTMRGAPTPGDAEIALLTGVFDDRQAFDPDEALKRYMAKREAMPDPGPVSASAPQSQGFGRKGT